MSSSQALCSILQPHKSFLAPSELLYVCLSTLLIFIHLYADLGYIGVYWGILEYIHSRQILDIGIYIWTILLSWYKQCQQLHWTNGRILGYRYSSEIDIYNCIRLGYREVDELQHMSDTSNGKYPGYKQVGKTNKHMQLSWIYQDRYIRRYELWLHQDH